VKGLEGRDRGSLLVGAGVGPMFGAIAVAAMGDVPAETADLVDATSTRSS
jgi:hypothetical protein